MDTLAEQLDSEVDQLRTLTFSEGTKKCYATHLRAYTRFCNLIGCAPVPVSNVNLCRYIAFLGRTKKYNTVSQYLNIVRILHLEHGLKNPLTDNFVSNCVLKGLKQKTGVLQKQKKPLTPALLLDIKSALNFENLFDVCFWAACLTCFFGLLRISNVCTGTESSNVHCIQRKDLLVTQKGCVINVHSSKTIQFAERVFQVALPFMCDNPLCPTSALIKFISQAGPTFAGSQELFAYQINGSVTRLTQINFRAKLKQCLPPHLEAVDYNSHSLRRGGCSYLLSCGVPLEAIKAIGDWKSLAVFEYMQPDLDFKFRAVTTALEKVNCVPT